MDDRYLGPRPPDLGPPIITSNLSRRRQHNQPPQAAVQQFWNKFNARHPEKVYNILPENPFARRNAAKGSQGTVHGQREARSYEEARAECVRDVDRIVKECRRTNQKYRDPYFDIEWDLKTGHRDCLDGLASQRNLMKPKGVKRVTDIFDKPQFYINGPTAGDVRQGRDGDCYLMAALCGLGNMQGLIDKVCVKHDQAVGVYGFVFYRDGEWQQTIVDDKLYLRAPDYDEAQNERVIWDDINRVDGEEEYRKAHQTGSRALYFAQCSDENETWLPLLEKAYAKAHGDYASIDGGFTGEAIEDLTGGVTCERYSSDILDRDAFWMDELMQVGKTFLFGCATGFYSDWLDTTGTNNTQERQGIAEGHAYSIMDAREVKGHRLLKLRNPWGRKEWGGKWSDGSAEWDAEWMQLLDHKFGNDGTFWISYEDLMKKYQHFDRTRIFGPEWNVSQCWTNVDVPWLAQYHTTKFSLTLTEKARVVIVLSQLDDTYFCGLEGGYAFDLQFRVEDANSNDPNDYVVRSNARYAMARSVNTDIELEAGSYWVLMKITATRQANKDLIEDVLPLYATTRRQKLIQIGRSYELAHAKGAYIESKQEKQERKARLKADNKQNKEEFKEGVKARAEKEWERRKARYLRNKSRRQKQDQIRAEKAKRHMGNGMMRSFDEDFEEMPNGHRRRNRSYHMMEEIGEPNPENGHGDETLNRSESVPLRLRSFSGEVIETGVPSSNQPQSSSPTEQQTAADSLVQPLDQVIQEADANTTEPEFEDKPPTPIIQVNGEDAVTDVKPLPSRPPISKEGHTVSANNVDTGTQRNVPITHHPTNAQPQSTNANYQPASEPHMDNSDNISIDSFGSFEWDTEIDMPSAFNSSSSSDAESDSDDLPSVIVRPNPPIYIPNFRPPPGDRFPDRGISIDNPNEPPFRPSPPPSIPDLSGNRDRRYIPPVRIDTRSIDGDDFNPVSNDPWNAVCIVGLRVYSTLEPEKLALKVVRADESTRKRKRRKGKKGDKKKESGKGKQQEDQKAETAVAQNIAVKLDPDDASKGATVHLDLSSTVQDTTENSRIDGTEI